jgi:sialate O-acetylesterase
MIDCMKCKPPLALALLGWSLIFLTAARAELVLGSLFRRGAVLQQGKSVPVWGWAEPGETISVEFKGQRKETTAGPNGKWRVDLDSLVASAVPADLVITGRDTKQVVSDVVVGEVWICAGQSNMARTVSSSQKFENEAAAESWPVIRHFKVEQKPSQKPEELANGDWAACDADSVGKFTATGFFFGRELYKKLGVPIGLINASVGGTPVESWMSEDALKRDPAHAAVWRRWEKTLNDFPNLRKAYKEKLSEWKAGKEAAAREGREFTAKVPARPEGKGSRMEPGSLYHGMVHPLIPYAVRGFVWYQGEANAIHFPEYASLFQTMIAQWRTDFAQGSLPFYFVQLPNLERPADPSRQLWAFQREAQAAALKLPGTEMAVTIDIGDPQDIHPRNKQKVGRRLALIAMALTYEQNEDFSGPRFESAVAEGDKMIVLFQHADGLHFAGGADGFELAGSDRIFHPAKAEIVNGRIVVNTPSVLNPVAVRYAWNNNPRAPLRNKAKLPAAPFRSDRWPPPEGIDRTNGK